MMSGACRSDAVVLVHDVRTVRTIPVRLQSDGMTCAEDERAVGPTDDLASRYRLPRDICAYVHWDSNDDFFGFRSEDFDQVVFIASRKRMVMPDTEADEPVHLGGDGDASFARQFVTAIRQQNRERDDRGQGLKERPAFHAPESSTGKV